MRLRPCAGMLVLCAACAPPRVIYEPARVVLARESDPVDVYLTGGARMPMGQSYVVRDTLYGRPIDGGQQAEHERAIPLASIEQITRSGSGPHPLVLTGLGFALGVFGGVLFLMSALGGS